uniref:Uncharacterized protein n=1 Tax=Magallana gigas TaxID=29159 RepID=A0A8W8NQK9_MAGGI
MAVNTRGRRMSEGIKLMIVRYFLLELPVEVIREKLKHLHGFVISRQGLYAFKRRWQSGKELRRTQKISRRKSLVSGQ